MMNKELIEQLLKTKKLIDFIIILMNQERKLERDLWDKKVIEHFLTLSGMSLEEFNKGYGVIGKGFFIDDFTEDEN